MEVAQECANPQERVKTQGTLQTKNPKRSVLYLCREEREEGLCCRLWCVNAHAESERLNTRRKDQFGNPKNLFAFMTANGTA